MKFTNRLFPYLVFLFTLFTISDASNPSRWRPTERTNVGKSQAWGQNQQSETSWNTVKSRRKSAWGNHPTDKQPLSQLPSAASSRSHSQSPAKNYFPSPSPRVNYVGDKHHKQQTISTSGTSSSAMGGIQKSSACVDNTSPAESCFDYFTFAVFWSPGFAYKQELQGKTIPKLRKKKTYPAWIIHGLWPSMYSRNVEIPPQCHRKNNVWFSLRRLVQNGLKEKLDNTWYSILSVGAESNPTFWSHEFTKHGTCATRSPAIKDDVNYFGKTYQLYEKLDIYKTLDKKQYNPGNSAKLREIIKIIEEKVQTKVKVHYTTNPKDNVNYLTEVFVCYSVQLTPINCPNSGRSNIELNKEIMYLDKMIK